MATESPFEDQEYFDRDAGAQALMEREGLDAMMDSEKNADKFVVDSWLHCKNKSDMQRLLKENYLSYAGRRCCRSA